MNRLYRIVAISAMVGALFAACSGGGEAPSTPDSQATTEVAGEDVPSRVCSLLTREQVNGVVPDHDGGNDKDTSEASLLKDVTLEHCQYLAVAGADMSLLDVFVWTATSDTGVESLPSHLRSCSDDDCRKLDSGSPGFLAVWSDSPHVVINRDRQILELSLTADDAATKSDALIDLAHAASARLWP